MPHATPRPIALYKYVTAAPTPFFYGYQPTMIGVHNATNPAATAEHIDRTTQVNSLRRTKVMLKILVGRGLVARV